MPSTVRCRRRPRPPSTGTLLPAGDTVRCWAHQAHSGTVIEVEVMEVADRPLVANEEARGTVAEPLRDGGKSKHALTELASFLLGHPRSVAPSGRIVTRAPHGTVTASAVRADDDVRIGVWVEGRCSCFRLGQRTQPVRPNAG